jgi:DNA mismatch repair protein MutS2
VNAHALRVLEFPRVLARVAERAASPQGRQAVLDRTPSADPEAVRRELDRVGQAMTFVGEEPAWGPPSIPGVESALQRLGLDGSVLDPQELHELRVLLESSRVLGEEMDGRGVDRFPGLQTIRDRLHRDEDAEEVLGRSVDADGQVLDEASRELARIRRDLRNARARIVQRLEAYVDTLPDRIVVPDASVSIRNGRYVVPIRREGKSEVGGIVHDESSTGSTLFVEPPLALELMNRVGDLLRSEKREVRRILRELTRRLAPVHGELTGSYQALVEFDSLHARARAGLAWEGHPPEIRDPGTPLLRVVRGRHPLLVAGDEEAVPFDLELEEGERCLVVSGPNTGGKSVFLKAVGLTSALAQAGCVPPVGDGTVLPLVTDIFADIGDEQSIAESLSTFSAHLENLKEIVREADRDALVLMDEMGTGTDPGEGAALARAILETLVDRGVLSVVTSHLGALKSLDREGSGIVNGSLQFDPDRMEPTYRFVKGRPGRSYGLAIARRLGFPAAILDRAEDHISEGEANVEDLLEKLERKEARAEELVADLAREKEEAARLRREVEERDEKLRAREQTAERRAREEARQLLMEAREEVEEAIRDVRSTAAAEELAEAGRRARRRVEEAARRQEEEKPDAPRPDGGGIEPEVGQRVKVAGSGAQGTVVEIRDERVVLETSGLRMEVKARDLEPAVGGGGGAPSADEASSGGGWTGPEVEASHEIDLRGLRVAEVELELGRALDGAVLGGLHEVRIIHGKGTGAVRSRVQELLGTDRRVEEFRLGRPGEGGGGVTVARIAG